MILTQPLTAILTKIQYYLATYKQKMTENYQETQCLPEDQIKKIKVHEPAVRET